MRFYIRMLVQNMPVHVVLSCARWSVTSGGFAAHDWAVESGSDDEHLLRMKRHMRKFHADIWKVEYVS